MLKRRQQQINENKDDLEDGNYNLDKDNKENNKEKDENKEQINEKDEIIKEHKINYKGILFVLLSLLLLFYYLNSNNLFKNNSYIKKINEREEGIQFKIQQQQQQFEEEEKYQLESENIKLLKEQQLLLQIELLKQQKEFEENEKKRKELEQQQQQQQANLPPRVDLEPISESVIDLDVIRENMLQSIENIRQIKESGRVIETDSEAQILIPKAQRYIREHLALHYGKGPYYISMELEFPESMNSPNASSKQTIIIELAPIQDVPYSVYFFLEYIVKNFKIGYFHRNAGHVLQSMLQDGKPVEKFAWQEYSPNFPHKKFTLGYAGRPSSSKAFYISTVDNTKNHGPASQGSKTEADSCFGKIHKGFEIVKRMQSQPGASPGAGWIKDEKDYITIKSLKLVTPQEFMSIN